MEGEIEQQDQGGGGQPGTQRQLVEHPGDELGQRLGGACHRARGFRTTLLSRHTPVLSDLSCKPRMSPHHPTDVSQATRGYARSGICLVLALRSTPGAIHTAASGSVEEYRHSGSTSRMFGCGERALGGVR